LNHCGDLRWDVVDASILCDFPDNPDLVVDGMAYRFDGHLGRLRRVSFRRDALRDSITIARLLREMVLAIRLAPYGQIPTENTLVTSREGTRFESGDSPG
jgi:hypothetical protein